MHKITIEHSLTQSELNTLHDIILDSLDLDISSNNDLIEYFNKFPLNIKVEAIKFGINDTEVTNLIYDYYLSNS